MVGQVEYLILKQCQGLSILVIKFQVPMFDAFCVLHRIGIIAITILNYIIILSYIIFAIPRQTNQYHNIQLQGSLTIQIYDIVLIDRIATLSNIIIFSSIGTGITQKRIYIFVQHILIKSINMIAILPSATNGGCDQQLLPGVPANWVNAKTRRMIAQLSFNGYVLAGNSIANMAESIPVQNDLDFWVQREGDYLGALDEIGKFYDDYRIYPSMIEMYDKAGNLPPVNLIFTNLSPRETVARFDFDYCRCYWSPSTGIYFYDGCLQSIRTKVIKNASNRNRIMRKRILKAVTYGYTFTNSFWEDFDNLLINPRFNRMRGRRRRNEDENAEPFPVKKHDLDMRKFRFKEVTIQLSNTKDVNRTIQQIAVQYEEIANQRDERVKLPVLIKLNGSQRDLLEAYSKLIVLQNPLSDVHYMEIKLGVNFSINYYPRRRRGSQEDEQQFEEEYEQDQLEIEKQSEHTLEANKATQETVKQGSVKTIIPERGEELLVVLNESGSAYLKVAFIPEELSNYAIANFEQLWALHPKEKHRIIMFEKEVEVSRYSQSYLNTPTDLSHTVSRSYMYSGYDTSTNNSELPQVMQRFYDYMGGKDSAYNQVIANWYEDQQDYIAAHADCQRGMIHNADISLLSLYPNLNDRNARELHVTPKQGTVSVFDKFVVMLSHGCVVTMCGTTQNEYTHGIPKAQQQVTPRISLSFRKMETQQSARS